MTINRGILCEIFFNDSKTGTPASLAGRIDANNFEEFNTNESDFISFVRSSYPPILKEDIEDIVLYDNEDGVHFPVVRGNLEFIT
ncbi:hypothetical protein LCGC14_1962450 [marine sediment metagenome]|uniref:Uncharacterized protein n=1 Tax=marine sediment metagenome TaxID=412755 RepID=A0A0F9FEH0_9ZZZZ